MRWTPWFGTSGTGCPGPPGSLFVVGDPKQSIYRFRRADIRTYLAAQAKLGGESALVTNFRTTAAILDAEALRVAEAADVAAVVARALAEGWTVADESTGTWRGIRPADIAILLPARTSLPYLQSALDDAGIAYRAESSSLVYQAYEIRDLMAALRVIADPGDRFSCVTACGRKSFNVLAPIPEERADHPAARAPAASS
jgi:ATP-dependent exoDNAse (exonuclease V) beta subunit